MKNPIISYFPNGITNIYKKHDITLSRIYNGIKNYEGFKLLTRQCNLEYQKSGKSAAYKRIRNQLPYITPDGIYDNRSTTGKLLKPSNLVQIDIDNLKAADIESVRQTLIADKHTKLLFTSPSGAGLKALVECRNLLLSSVGVLIAYYAELGIRLDKSTLHDKTACFLCHDKNAYLNLESEIFTLPKNPQTKRGGYPSHQVTAGATVSEATNFCNKVIESEAIRVINAPQHEGSATLNFSAYCLGRYEGAGLSRLAALEALKQAFLNRPFSKHYESEFLKIFNCGFNAGKAKPKTIGKPSRYLQAQKNK
jgi:hypothetical protein